MSLLGSDRPGGGIRQGRRSPGWPWPSVSHQGLHTAHPHCYSGQCPFKSVTMVIISSQLHGHLSQHPFKSATTVILGWKNTITLNSFLTPQLSGLCHCRSFYNGPYFYLVYQLSGQCPFKSLTTSIFSTQYIGCLGSVLLLHQSQCHFCPIPLSFGSALRLLLHQL